MKTGFKIVVTLVKGGRMGRWEALHSWAEATIDPVF